MPIDLLAGWVNYDGTGVASAGDSVDVRVQSYARSAIPQWAGRLYLSADAHISSTDIPVADFAAIAVVTSLRVRLPQSVAPGLYYFGVVLDPDGQLPDTNRRNNAVASVAVIGIGVAPSAVTDAPAPLAPADRAVFDAWPRALELDWSDVPSATAYEVEVDFCYPWTEPDYWNSCGTWFVWDNRTVAASALNTTFVGAQPGRWRVRGLDSRGVRGPASAWQVFRWLR